MVPRRLCSEVDRVGLHCALQSLRELQRMRLRDLHLILAPSLDSHVRRMDYIRVSMPCIIYFHLIIVARKKNSKNPYKNRIKMDNNLEK